MEKIIIQLISALIGSFGFSILFNLDKKDILPASLGGLLCWGSYLCFSHLGCGVFVSTVLSAALIKIYSEFFARTFKAPTTVFYIPAVIPLVPGGSLYYTMSYAVSNEWESFKKYGWETLQVALGIAIGISFVTAIFYYFENVSKDRKMKKNNIDKV